MAIGRQKNIAVTIAVLAVLGYIGLWIANFFVDLGGFEPSGIFFIIIVGILLYIVVVLLKQARVGTLDLDKVLIPILVGAGLVYILMMGIVPIPDNFSAAILDLKSMVGLP